MDIRIAQCSVCNEDISYTYDGTYKWDLKHHFTKRGNCPAQRHKCDKNGVN